MPLWFEHHTDNDLRYRIDEFDSRGNIVQCHGRLRWIDAARAAFSEVVKKHPGCEIVLRENMRVIMPTRPSD